MLLKASTDYGLRAILYLASKGTTCSSRDIAEEMAIPRDYLIQIAQQLRNAGLIVARAGKNGGYSLAKDPQDISLLEIMEALRDDNRVNNRDPRIHRRSSEASLSPSIKRVKQAYSLVLDSYDSYLSSVTIQTILLCIQNSSDSQAILAKQLRRESDRLAGVSKAKQGEVTRRHEGRSLPEEKPNRRYSVGLSEESRQLLRDQRIAI